MKKKIQFLSMLIETVQLFCDFTSIKFIGFPCNFLAFSSSLTLETKENI